MRYLALARSRHLPAHHPGHPRPQILRTIEIYMRVTQPGVEHLQDVRTALSDKAITACDDRSVTFDYRDSSDGQRK